jgi:carboxymethylenebutenolidase
MGQTRKIPAEAVELYTRFIHGEISRRDFFNEVQRFAVVGLTGAAIVEALMPNYALGQQVRKDDERIKANYETVPSPNGNGYIRGYFVRPFSADSRSETPAKLPGIIVIHENRGLNPHLEDVARRFALRISWHLRRTRFRRSAVIRATTTRAASCFPRSTLPRGPRISSPRRSG